MKGQSCGNPFNIGNGRGHARHEVQVVQDTGSPSGGICCGEKGRKAAIGTHHGPHQGRQRVRKGVPRQACEFFGWVHSSSPVVEGSAKQVENIVVVGAFEKALFWINGQRTVDNSVSFIAISDMVNKMRVIRRKTPGSSLK